MPKFKLSLLATIVSLMMNTNEEQTIEGTKMIPCDKNKGSKRIRDPTNWKKEVKKRKLYVSKTLPNTTMYSLLIVFTRSVLNNARCQEIPHRFLRL